MKCNLALQICKKFKLEFESKELRQKIKTAMRLNWLAALRQLTNITLPDNNKLETDFHLVASGMVWILVPNTVQRKRIPMVQTAANRLK